MKHVRRRKLLLTDDIRAWIPPSKPHGQRDSAKLEGPERSQSGDEQRGDTGARQKAHNTDLAWERASHLQGSLRDNSLDRPLIRWRFLHLFLLLLFFRVFSENRFLKVKTSPQKLSSAWSPSQLLYTITWKQETHNGISLFSFLLALMMRVSKREIVGSAPHDQKKKIPRLSASSRQ